MVGAAVTRLEYRSAPGGAARAVPLVEYTAGQREFSFRSATLAHGRLLAYGADGAVLSTSTF
ncbi:hypothetical protein [Phytohabitans rumicis]|uniref:hypothetical protein n=1 Tax=Phytohabitans rumicis TaxID=1076125 RepID=UPI001566AE4E|nr:hypothetical protein [Phytohabitans rumicis]